ncbi:MAG: hypothetical protein ACTSWW_13405 [Promethearchaeota archaeon]
MFEKYPDPKSKPELISKRSAFKVMIVFFILLSSLLMADDLYFDNNKVWKNCKVIDRSDKKINILFLERYGHLYIEKPISSVFGIVETSINSDIITKIEHLSTDKMDMLIKTEPMRSVYHLKLNDIALPDKIANEINIIRENKPKNLISSNRLIGLGSYSRNELKRLYDHHDTMTDDEWLMQYCSKVKNPHPAAYLNFLGIASIKQRDYEFGFLIMACEIGGAWLALETKNEFLRYVGFIMLDFGLIAGIVRPYVYASKYNNALSMGLQIEYGL